MLRLPNSLCDGGAASPDAGSRSVTGSRRAVPCEPCWGRAPPTLCGMLVAGCHALSMATRPRWWLYYCQYGLEKHYSLSGTEMFFASPPQALHLLQGFNRMGLLSLIRKLKRREKEIRVLMV